MTLPKHASARLILADPRDRVLLFQHQRDEASAAHWITPGGGLEPGETPAAGVIRELREETGFQLTDVGEPVAFAAGRWRSPRGVLFDQVTWYFFARGDGGELDVSGQEAYERIVLRQHRWMTVSEIAATQHVSPLGLVDLLPALLAGHRPETPLRFPWRDD